jgi:2'-hydroxyisoflavone reductase
MNVVVLGGYRFAGRALIDELLARGHTVAAFNRGNDPLPPGVEHIAGDRDDPSPLAGRTWDVAIDTSGYIPRHLTASAGLLAPNVNRYAFVSTLSVYGFPVDAGADETHPLVELTPGADPDDNRNNETYGMRKALCEAAAEAAMPGRVLAIRAGFIVGPYDYTDRFNVWIERAAHQVAMVVPGPPGGPLQLIDVRDLAAWIVDASEAGLTGPYNVTGPERTAMDVARACVAGTGSSCDVVSVPTDVALAAGIVPWEHLPFWLEPEHDGLMRMDIRKALAAGLRTRPLAETVAATYAWLRTSSHERKVRVPPETERAALETARTRMAT